jgi:hypothetical protein
MEEVRELLQAGSRWTSMQPAGAESTSSGPSAAGHRWRRRGERGRRAAGTEPERPPWSRAGACGTDGHDDASGHQRPGLTCGRRGRPQQAPPQAPEAGCSWPWTRGAASRQLAGRDETGRRRSGRLDRRRGFAGAHLLLLLLSGVEGGSSCAAGRRGGRRQPRAHAVADARANLLDGGRRGRLSDDGRRRLLRDPDGSQRSLTAAEAATAETDSPARRTGLRPPRHRRRQRRPAGWTERGRDEESRSGLGQRREAQGGRPGRRRGAPTRRVHGRHSHLLQLEYPTHVKVTCECKEIVY